MKNRRKSAVCLLIFACVLLLAAALAGGLAGEPAGAADFTRKNLPPCPSHPFGTDRMGRDMLARTLAGLSLSVRIGALTAVLSGMIALISWLIDLVLGIPHILLMILVSIACGKGALGVTAGVALTHWPSLARLVRSEVLQLKQAPWLQASRRLGAPGVLVRHLPPHLLPQLLTGLILQFPHAILHEAGVTFLGFGLSPEQPAIGVILEESMGYLAAGRWWLALFPGLSLAGVVGLFALAGERLRLLLSPATAQE